MALLLALVLGFLVGTHRSDVRSWWGAHPGVHVATIESGGWSYGVSQSVAWIILAGSYHEDGWPTVWGEPAPARR